MLVDQLQAEQKLARQRLAPLQGLELLPSPRAVRRRSRRARCGSPRPRTSSGRWPPSPQWLQSEPPPLFDGMSVEGRRAVNVAVIGYAELLFDRLAPRRAGGSGAPEHPQTGIRCHYGTPQECHSLLHRQRTRSRTSNAWARTLAEVKSVRTACGVGCLPQPRGNGTECRFHRAGQARADMRRMAPNVLLDEYWDIYRALVR